jgi:hypothetical protein
MNAMGKKDTRFTNLADDAKPLFRSFRVEVLVAVALSTGPETKKPGNPSNRQLIDYTIAVTSSWMRFFP